MKQAKKMNIGVFFGGKSPEHDVSIITAQLIISVIKKSGHQVTPVYISKEGKWFIGGELGELNFFISPDWQERIKDISSYSLSLPDTKGKLIFKKLGLLSKEIVIDLAFPAFHGEYGEDGTIQGFFEMYGLPYVGCDVTSSAIAIDKILTKLFYKALCIPTTEFIYFDQSQWNDKKEAILNEIKEKLKWPLFVKPPRLGSSIGMTKVSGFEELKEACEVALRYGNKVLVEESVEKLADITCALLGNNKPKASLLQESVFEDDHFSYEEKYLKDGGAQLGNAQKNLVIPARLDKEATRNIQKTAVKIYKTLGCSGTARIDFLYDKDKKVFYANEINPLPGTLYHHLWKESGIEIDKLINKLIKLALRKKTANKNMVHTFKSDILKHAKSIKLQIG